MPLDNNATVSFCFTGLGLICINKDGKLQVGILECPDHRHELVVDIQGITTTSDNDLTSEVIPHQLNFDQNLRIEAVNPSSPGAKTHPEDKGPLDRKNGQADPRDYRWIVDLEGEAFRNQPVVFPPLVKDPIAIKPVITISDGVLYSEQRTDKQFFSVPTEAQVTSSELNEDAPNFLGNVAFKVGFDIVCEDKPESGVLFKNGAGDKPLLELRREMDGKQYSQFLITVKNECDIRSNPDGHSDHTLYYKAVSYQGGEEFDLRRKDTGDNPGNPGTISGELVCNFAFLSQFDGFPTEE